MNLTELFRNPKLTLTEGGNLSSQSPGWQGVIGDHQAQELDLHVHNRAYVQNIVGQTLQAINDTFAQQHKEPLWHESSVKTQKFLSGSTFQFMDKKIPDEEFVRVKPKVGDIDTQASDKHAETIKNFLGANVGKQIGDAVLLGFSPGNNQYTSLWEIKLKDLPVKIQIDFEYGAHEETGLPTDWQSYSHSSSWDDLSQNIKGVFHKYLDRALPYAQTSTKYVARVLKKSTKISDAPVTDSDYSFAVSGPGGGGVSQKYIPYSDPVTGKPMVKDGIPVMQLLDPNSRQYIQNLSQQFEIFFGKKPKGNDQELKNSFVGTVQLIAKYLDEQKKEEIAQRFLSICFEPGSQMITKDDPARDRDIKFSAIDYMLENMKLANAAALRKQAIEMATAYATAFQNKTSKTLKEESQVKAQFRKGMPHLHDLKPADLLDLLDEIHDGNGRFKLENIPLNVKVDGFGGRFGKNSDGKPFMATSRTEPRYEPGFVAHHQKKGTTDPEILGRAKLFDDLFEEMMKAVKLVDSNLGPEFLVNKQVTCEVLYLPFATETPEGKLKFVGIHYDKLPTGVKLALVPFRITDATTGDDLADSNKIVQELTSLGQSGSVMFIDNSLTQNEALDVTALVPPVENIEQIKSLLASGKLAQKREAKELLGPVALALERAIINDPNIVGKDILGKDYEGIVLNTRLGPVKVTSQEQRNVISAKNAAKASARTERPRGEAKTAVVAIGSFIGHKGHEELFDYTVKKAKEVGGDPYLFIGNAEGKDDPIPPSVKVQTWHKLYPQYAQNISTVNHEGGTLIQKIKHELINPLPGKPPRYDNIIIMVGEDRAGMNMPAALMKAVNKFQGYEHVKVSLDVTPRGTGISGTALRNSLKNDSPEKALAVWSNAFDVNKLGVEWIKHLMDITRKGMGIQQSQPAPVSETRLLNALIRSEQLTEGTSIESTLRAIINDIGEPVTNVYDTMKFQAKKYMENHGELGRGFRMVAAGVGSRWVQNMYVGRLQNELYDLCRYNSRRTVDLQDFLRGVESKGELDSKRSFGSIANELPGILAKLGQHLNAPQLVKNAQRWIQNKAAYEQYIDQLEAEADDDYNEPAAIKPPKSNVVGQQNAQVDQIVNNVLSKLPTKIQGDIRNAIARAPNKLQALQVELSKRGVKAPMAEGLNEFAPGNGRDEPQYTWANFLKSARYIATLWNMTLTPKGRDGATMWADFAPDGVRAGIFLLDMENGSVEYVIVAVENGQYSTVREGTVPMSRDGIGYLEENVGKWWQEYKKKNSETTGADEGYGTHPSQRVDPRTGKRYVPPKSPLGQGVAEGQQDDPEDYRAHLIKTLPAMMNYFAKTGKGWSPSKEQLLAAVDTAYEVMKHTGDVQQAGKALMDELNTLHRMSQGQQGVAEGFPNFNREWGEATRYPEFVNLGKEKWIELVSKGKPVTVTRKNVNKINNTDAADPRSFKLLDTEKQKRALAQLATGNVEMPIVARYSDGYLELIGGNTRLTAQMAKDGQAKVWLFNVPEELQQGVAEERTSAAVRMQRAADRQRAKSDASLRRTPSSIPKSEPKKADKTVPVSEDIQNIMDSLINKIITNEAISNNKR